MKQTMVTFDQQVYYFCSRHQTIKLYKCTILSNIKQFLIYGRKPTYSRTQSCGCL